MFGTPKKATGTPYTFGMINDETGAVTFPEARQGAIAAVNYVNNYLGGINYLRFNARKRPAVNAAAINLVQASNPQDKVFIVNFNENIPLPRTTPPQHLS